MIFKIFFTTVISDFTNRFLQPERANIVQLVTLVSFVVALLMIPRLVKMIQRGDMQFNNSIWRWALGIFLTILAPNLLGLMILKTPISQIVQDSSTEPVKTENSGFIQDGKIGEWLKVSQEEKTKAPSGSLQKANYSESELGSTVINPDADPNKFGIDLIEGKK